MMLNKSGADRGEETVVHKGFCSVVVAKRNGRHREKVISTNSVSALIYVWDIDKILLVCQPRFARETDENPNGDITELVAGRFDVDLSVEQLLIKEAQEELGATVADGNIMLMNEGRPMSVSAGLLTEMSYLAYIELSIKDIEDTERFFGNQNEGEQIKRVWMSYDEFRDYICDDLRVWGMKQWFIANIMEK